MRKMGYVRKMREVWHIQVMKRVLMIQSLRRQREWLPQEVNLLLRLHLS